MINPNAYFPYFCHDAPHHNTQSIGPDVRCFMHIADMIDVDVELKKIDKKLVCRFRHSAHST